jgi:hypothetical protein
VRFALSKLALNTKGRPRRVHPRANASAIRRHTDSLSTTHGPAIRGSERGELRSFQSVAGFDGTGGFYQAAAPKPTFLRIAAPPAIMGLRLASKPAMFTTLTRAALAAALLGGFAFAAETPGLYRNDFQTAELGEPPAEMLVLDGDFSVREEGGNRFLELASVEVETFGALFGPAQTNDVAVTARVFGTARGRRLPAFGIGLGGVGGYKLQLSPARRALELVKGDWQERSNLATHPITWQSGTWTHLRLQVRNLGAGVWQVAGKAWAEGTPEPAAWQVSIEEKEPPRTGRPALWGLPFAGTPIRYDDLELRLPKP